MDSEELIRKVMSEVMAQLDHDNATFSKKSAPKATSAPAGGGVRVSRSDYPLGENIPERIKTRTGKALTDVTYESVISGETKPEDVRVSSETLEMQAQVAESVGRDTLANNLRRAAELTVVPDDELLTIYDRLRPYRSTKQELYTIADDLESNYGCRINATFIREAADVYEFRGRLRTD